MVTAGGVSKQGEEMEESPVLMYGEAEGMVQGLRSFPLRDTGSGGGSGHSAPADTYIMQQAQNYPYVIIGVSDLLVTNPLEEPSTGRGSQVRFRSGSMWSISDPSGMPSWTDTQNLQNTSEIRTLIRQLISIEIWKVKVFPVLCQLQDFQPSSTFPLYMVIHHEATIINLLETVFYHKEVCESAEDLALDLIDYCHRKLTILASKGSPGEFPVRDRMMVNVSGDVSSLEELKQQSEALEFDVALKCLSVLRYVTDHTDSLSLSVTTRLLNTHNLPCVLVELMEHCPWSRRNKGQLQRYENGRWLCVPAEDQQKMTKLDGQVWIALYNLLLRPECQQKYNINNFTKGQLLKVSSGLSDIVLVHLPAVNDVILQGSCVSLPLSQVPEVWDSIIRENSGKWKAIAKHQVKHAFSPSEEDLRRQAQRSVPRTPHTLSQCQVKHWRKHKTSCDLVSEATKKMKED
ncbi:PREDICTED: zinc finger MYND domain-containing protein 10, partial [Nanorana parkeri]|uniref:zinc finger MYND domain-containing protein 10 n=1 Tax=Nanorana parkeri TaxID=125878 RepID=UPI000854749E